MGVCVAVGRRTSNRRSKALQLERIASITTNFECSRVGDERLQQGRPFICTHRFLQLSGCLVGHRRRADEIQKAGLRVGVGGRFNLGSKHGGPAQKRAERSHTLCLVSVMARPTDGVGAVLDLPSKGLVVLASWRCEEWQLAFSDSASTAETANRQTSRRSTDWLVIAAIRSKSLSACNTVSLASSAVAAMSRSGMDGARC